MAGARDLEAPRLQFRLDLADPAQQALYDELMALPKGKRNAVIIERLLRRDELDAALYATVRKAVRDELMGNAAAPKPTQAQPAAELPDELFDTKPFVGKT